MRDGIFQFVKQSPKVLRDGSRGGVVHHGIGIGQNPTAITDCVLAKSPTARPSCSECTTATKMIMSNLAQFENDGGLKLPEDKSGG
jgi:hypothetical protein